LGETNKIRLTQFSHGAGCGCKIAPGVLEEILKSNEPENFPGLLVGYEHKDDAAVLDLGDGTALISTTDFFMPIVDDPYDFGKIAAVNAISDVYAMGGKPILAIGILGWPIDKLSAKIAACVIQGAKEICKEARIPLAGGHSIDSPEPIFGLSVNGRVDIKNLKSNGGARPGDLLFLTKPLGVGILTTAEKKSILKSEHASRAKASMLRLNTIGELLGKYSWVHAITDVTGFGLAGHCLEMCEASKTAAEIHYVNVPILDNSIQEYVALGAIPGGTHRNWKSYSHKISLAEKGWFSLVADPQTSGGLLIAVDSQYEAEMIQLLTQENVYAQSIGVMIERQGAAADVAFI
jgi:selenide,water dikinase